jgi:hypothetical protein
MIYAVSFSGTFHDCDPEYYCGAYSTKAKAEQYIKKSILLELENFFGSQIIKVNNKTNLKKLSIKKLLKIYQKHTDTSYVIKKFPMISTKTVYSLEYSSPNNSADLLGIFDSFENAKKRAAQIMLEDLRQYYLDKDEFLDEKSMSILDIISCHKKIFMGEINLSINTLKVDSDFIYQRL